ncbi:cell division protein SepF [Modestobacter sp. SYSU DS0511]
MAGAMRRMGVYLGLVEDDDTRGGYDRYAARQSDYDRDERRYDRYGARDEVGYDAEARFADDAYPAGDYGYEPEYADDYTAEEPFEPAAEAAPEPAVSLGRRPAARPLNLAGSSGSTSASSRLVGGAGLTSAGASLASAGSGRGGGISAGGGAAGSAGLAMREPAAAPVLAPAPEPAPKPDSYRITTVHPASYNEARTIGERFRDGMPVIMNLTDMEHADAKRLVDFAIGLTFGLHGSIERVTAKVFLLSPQDVDVTAEDKARIREGGFFNQS